MFVILYTSAILLELVEHWRDPLATATFLLLTGLCLLRINKHSLFVIALSSSIYFFGWHFPDVANHVNLILFTNAAIILATLWVYATKPGIHDRGFFKIILPVLRLCIILTFAIAGLHKFNRDFLDPAVSCVTGFSRTIRDSVLSDVLGTGVPAVVVLLVIGLAAAFILRRQRRTDFAIPRIDAKVVAAPLIAIAGLALVLIATVSGTAPLGSLNGMVFYLIIVFILCWQLVEGPLLLVRRFQWVALALSLLVHSQLAMIRIVDFQSIAIALLATFIPGHMWRAWLRSGTVGIGPVRLHRIQIFYLLNIVVGGGAMLLRTQAGVEMPNHYLVTGILFNLSLLILLWPFITELFSKHRRWRWRGTPVLNRATPAALYAIPLALVLFGLTSYLGLRTAGNFSMFSNLRTETATSNHLLFAGNP